MTAHKVLKQIHILRTTLQYQKGPSGHIQLIPSTTAISLTRAPPKLRRRRWDLQRSLFPNELLPLLQSSGHQKLILVQHSPSDQLLSFRLNCSSPAAKIQACTESEFCRGIQNGNRFSVRLLAEHDDRWCVWPRSLRLVRGL